MTRIATWNVNSVRARLDHLRQWLPSSDVDVLAVQETKVQDFEFPGAEIVALGYRPLIAGQKNYNGVAFFTRLEARVFAREIPGLGDAQARVLGADFGAFALLDLYVPNGSEVDSDKYVYKLRWLDGLIAWLPELLDAHEHLFVLGDFNIAPTDEDVHDPDQWRGRILCSDAERERLQALSALGLEDVFRRFEQAPQSFSWWDYRGGGFRRNEGLRIDLILASSAAAAATAACHIDTEPRRWDKPSDHAPVIAEFDAGGV